MWHQYSPKSWLNNSDHISGRLLGNLKYTSSSPGLGKHKTHFCCKFVKFFFCQALVRRRPKEILPTYKPKDFWFHSFYPIQFLFCLTDGFPDSWIYVLSSPLYLQFFRVFWAEILSLESLSLRNSTGVCYGLFFVKIYEGILYWHEYCLWKS